MTRSDKDLFLSLVSLGIGHQGDTLPKQVDWSTIQAIANSQGLAAIVMDGLDQLTKQGVLVNMPPMQKKMWIGEVLQNFEYRYELYRRAIAELAGFYNAHGFKMMVLKGFSCSLDWPKPEHRPTGDIDIWQFGKWREADKLIEKEKSIEVDSTHHHHTIFYWRDFMVENHYDFDNIYARRSNREIEPIFKELAQDDSHFIDLYGEKVYLASANLNALFLIRHMAAHFVGADINLRQVLDWAFFVEKHGKEVDWNWLAETLERFHMKDFISCINAICVEDLGFAASIFQEFSFYPEMKEKVLNDILEPAFGTPEPKELIPRLVFKFRRWKGNSWKQKLCYSESLWSAFWSGVWAKILKPSSF